MKIGIVCALAFVALVNGLDELNTKTNHDTEPHDVSHIDYLQACEPGTSKKEDCNNCFCLPNGSGWACTRMGCNTPLYLATPDANVDESDQNNPTHRVKREFGRDFTCTPNETFMDDCNHCFCLSDGRTAGCTLMACPPKGR